MGISSDGLLIYGFDLGIEDEQPFSELLADNEEFDDFIANEAGIEGWTENAKDDYWKRYREAVEACPVELHIHCSYDYPMYVLGVRGANFTAYRGDPTIIEKDAFNISEDKIKAAKEWCEKYKIEWQEPKWVLCSLYG
jgi:hypothetical protein